MKICFVVNSPEFLVSHRLEICLELLRNGHEVHVICPRTSGFYKLQRMGFSMHRLEFGRGRVGFFSELKSIVELVRFFYLIKPSIAHLVTIKPYLYGGIAARIARVPAVVSAVSGLGIVFSSSAAKFSLLRVVLFPLFKFSFGHRNQRIVFQNLDDSTSLIDWGVVDRRKTALIRGSGVNLNDYCERDELEQVPVVSMASRLLKDKGVQDFVDAAKILRDRAVNARFWLIGGPDEGNDNSISLDQLARWEGDGLIEWLGYRNDVADLFFRSNIIALPSFYGEGLPKVLMEAAACGRAVVTTDHPGCRDAITEGVSGLLVPARNPSALADSIEILVKNSAMRKAMGKAGRQLAEEEFAVAGIVHAHLAIYKELYHGVDL